MENYLQNFLSQQALNMIGKQLGFSNGIPPQVIGLATQLLMSGMAKNVQSEQGAGDLFNALNNDHANSGILEKILDFIPGAQNGPGQGILGHVLGNKLDAIVQVFAKATGLPPQKAKQLLIIVAPLALAYLANRMKKMRMNQRELAYDVRDHYYRPGGQQQFRGDNGILMKLLDRDGDGQLINEAIKILGGMMAR